MRKFLTKIFLMLLPFIVMGVIMEILIRKIPNDYQFKKEYLEEQAHEIETLILGSSHSFYGVNPVYFTSKTFNASHISQTLNYDFEILKKYDSKFKRLKTIVLPISYFTLYENLNYGEETWRVKNYVIYYDTKSHNQLKNYSEVLSLPLRDNLKRIIEHYVFRKSAISCSTLGWGTEYSSKKAQNLSETANSAAKRHTYLNQPNPVYIQLFQENIQTLNNLANWCEKRKIKLLLFTPPAYSDYSKNLHPIQLKNTIEAAQKVASRHHNCKYFNLLNDTIFKETDYYDADHLSEIGAKKLSEIINLKIYN